MYHQVRLLRGFMEEVRNRLTDSSVLSNALGAPLQRVPQINLQEKSERSITQVQTGVPTMESKLGQMKNGLHWQIGMSTSFLSSK